MTRRPGVGAGRAGGADAVPACGDTDFHKSMGLDACLALGADGIPLIAGPLNYALSLPVE